MAYEGQILSMSICYLFVIAASIKRKSRNTCVNSNPSIRFPLLEGDKVKKEVHDGGPMFNAARCSSCTTSKF